jgi:hypothetical protein
MCPIVRTMSGDGLSPRASHPAANSAAANICSHVSRSGAPSRGNDPTELREVGNAGVASARE